MPRRGRLEAIAAFRVGAERLLRVVESLSEAQRTSPIYREWTVKHVLAHIAAWDRMLTQGVDELLGGAVPAFVQYATRAGEAQFNAQVVEEIREATFDEILPRLRSAHDRLVARLEALSDEEWDRKTAHRWGNRTAMTVASLFDYAYKGETHYGGHASEIEVWAASQEGGDEPDS